MFELTPSFSPSQKSGNENQSEPSQSQQSNSGGGYQRKPFKKKKILTYPYVPISIYYDARNDTPEVRENVIKVIYALLSKAFTVRVNGDDAGFIDDIKANNPVKREDLLEIYIPWKPYDGIESKYWYSAEEIKEIAKTYSSEEVWNKVPKHIHARMARNIRMLFGNNNNSCCTGLIVWTEDGAETATQLGRGTGTAYHILRAALSHALPVININTPDAAMRLTSRYNLG